MGEMTLGGIDTSEYEGELKKVSFNETVVSLGGNWYINNLANYINRTVTHLLNMQHIFSPWHISTPALHISWFQITRPISMYATISPDIKLLDKLGV